jgi:hypothetical protein
LGDGTSGGWAEQDDSLVLVVVDIVIVVIVAARLRRIAAWGWDGGIVVEVDADV